MILAASGQDSSRYRLYLGDSKIILAGFDDFSIDAIVTDPPAGIGFMGKDWDDYRRAHNPSDAGRDNVFGRTSRKGPEYGRARDGFIAAMAPIFTECLRVLKPGGHALVWALPRTSHWTATVLEEAGFEIRDCLQHIFGTGFPKSKNIGDGRGTALKPAAEFWWLVRRPLDGTVAANTSKYGTGALNIDACRVATPDNAQTCRVAGKDGGRWPAHLVFSHAEGCERRGTKKVRGDARVGGEGRRPGGFFDVGAERGDGAPNGRVYGDEDGMEITEDWCCVEGCPVRELDEQSGVRSSGARRAGVRKGMGYHGGNGDGGPQINASVGGASRFFTTFEPDTGVGFRYQGKALTKEKNLGLLPGTKNTHPTVKSLGLMRWLCRLITPPGGTVLDPFAGSGSTIVAALEEGFRAVGIEMNEDYFEIMKARVNCVPL